MHDSAVPGDDAVRFPAGGPAAAAPQPVWQGGSIEVEFAEEVRPELVAPTSGTVGLTSPSAGELSSLNELFQRYGLERAEPSIPITPRAADEARAVAVQSGVQVPHYGNLVTLHFPPDANLSQIARELNDLPEVVRAVPVPAAIPPRITAADPLLGTTDQLDVDPVSGLEHQWYVFRCHADQAWQLATGDGVVIADVDWGYRVSHQDLVPNLDMTHAFNSFDGGSNVTTGGSVSHGTAVLGLAGAAQNGVGMTGIAPRAVLWPIQADSGPGTWIGGNSWATGIEWVRTADSGDRRKVVILEVQTGAYGNYEMVPSVNAAIRTAIASGVVVCVAAGNGNRDASIDDSGLPIPETGSILVGATAYSPNSNPRAWFSNFGDRIIVAAPGDGSHDLTCNVTSDSSYRNGFGGTSGATPKVAATAALMLSVNPALTHAEIRDILRSTGSMVSTDAGKPVGTFLDTAAAVAEARRLAGRSVFLRGTPAVRRDAAGRLQLFVRGRPEAMLSDVFQLGQTAPNNGWTAWVAHGHGFESASPALGQNADGRLEAFAVAPGEMVHKWETAPGAGWSDWTSLFAGTGGPPAVARNADGRLEVFSVFADGALYHVWQITPNGGWSTPASLGGSFGFPGAIPAVAASQDGRLEVFAIAADGTLQHAWQTAPNGGWSGWVSHGGSLQAGAPFVARNADGRLEVFALGTDGQIYHMWQLVPNGSWSGWGALAGAALASAPAVGTNADGRLELVAVAGDGSLQHAWQTAPNSGWSSWASLGSAGGGFLSDAAPGISTNADGRLEIFVVASDSELYHAWQTAPNNGWSGWGSFGRPTL